MKENILENVINDIEESREEIVNLLQEFVQTNSVNINLDPSSPGEKEMSEKVQKIYKELGLNVEVLELEKDRPNVIATLKGEEGKPRLLFNAHLDTTVSHETDRWLDPLTWEEKEDWTEGPFSGTIKDGWIYGRGTCDHKSEIVAAIFAIKTLRKFGISLKGDLVIVNDVDEETGGEAGMQYLVKEYPFNVDKALYGCTSDFTPSSLDYFSALSDHNIIYSLAGYQAYKVSVKGRVYHGLTPKTGINGAEAALIILNDLEEYIRKINKTVDPLIGTGKPILRVVNIKTSGKRGNYKDAEEVDIYFNRKLSPNENPEEIFDDFKEQVKNSIKKHKELSGEVVKVKELPSFKMDKNDKLIEDVNKSFEKVMGKKANITGLPTPVGFSQFLAKKSIPTVLFGLGYVNFHHSYDERIKIEDLVNMSKIYALTFINYLGLIE